MEEQEDEEAAAESSDSPAATNIVTSAIIGLCVFWVSGGVRGG